MIESEAKRKWCPGAMAHNGDLDNPLVLNRNSWGDPAPNCTCITDKCACWVWDKKTKEVMAWNNQTLTVEINKEQWQGHCGLAR